MITVIVLFEDYYQDFPYFINKLNNTFSKMEENYEIVIVANGTGNFLRSIQNELFIYNHRIKAFEFGTKVTQAICLKTILSEVNGEKVVICGSYQQITDESLEYCIYSMDKDTDIISPWRKNRLDPAFNQIQSKVFNWIVRRLVKTDLHDFSCTVKVCHRSVLEEIDLYGNMFRFFPVLAAAKGFRIKEISVEHFQERGVTGFYHFTDYITRLLDIVTMFFNTRFSRKPLRFFSFFGVGCLLIGISGIAVLFVQRFFIEMPLGNRPTLFLLLFVTILGVLVSSAGLLGEVIAFTNGRHKKEYTVETKL